MRIEKKESLNYIFYCFAVVVIVYHRYYTYCTSIYGMDSVPKSWNVSLSLSGNLMYALYSTLHWLMKFEADEGKYQLLITRLLIMSTETMWIGQQSVVVIRSACVPVGRYNFIFSFFDILTRKYCGSLTDPYLLCF